VYLYDIDDLHNVVEMNKSERDKEAVKAYRIIAEEKLKFSKWLSNMESTPTIIQLRSMVEGLVRGEVEKTMGRLEGLSEYDQERTEKLVAAITGKMLYRPLHYLKNENHCVSLPDRINTVRTLFQLDNGNDDPESP
jgi:glutamyl-tRNA reductase